jgi:hypothetical protein
VSESFLKEVLPIIVWVLIMIVSGRIKKNRQKGPVPTRKRRKPAARPVGDPSGRRTGAAAPPTPGAAAPATFRAEAPSRSRAEAPPAAIQRVVPTGLAVLIDHAFQGTAWDASLGGQMRSRGLRLRDPVQVLGWIDELVEASVGQLDDISALLAEAVDSAIGGEEFNASTIDEFVELSPRLAATWSRGILADALGLALLGPGFADLREQVEAQRRGRDVVPLAIAGDPGAVRMPYCVRRALLEAGVAAYDLEAGWGGSGAWADAGDTVVFDLGGLQQIPVPAAPMADATIAIFQQLRRSRIPSMVGRDLLEIASHHPWRGHLRRHLKLAETLSKGGQVPLAEADLLPVFLRLRSLAPDGDWEPRLLALRALHHRSGARRGRQGRPAVPIGRRSRAALVEGFLLTEILGPDLGRPAARRRAGGR